MGEYRVSDKAEAEIDAIWLYIGQNSGSIERATQVVEEIFNRFWFLAAHPYAGRSRDHDLKPGYRSFSVGNFVIVYKIKNEDWIEIAHVTHGRRDIPALFQESGEAH